MVGIWDGCGSAYLRGNELWRAGQLAEAEAAYRQAANLSAAPDIRLNLGNVLLCQGRDAEGWALYQERLERRTSVANSLGFPEWAGEPLDGRRLFIWSEQGLGDHIFAARYLLGLRAERTTLVTPVALARLFSGLADEVFPRTDPFEVAPRFDYWTLPLSLPQWVAATATPYLSVTPQATPWQTGIMWRGNTRPDPGRSLPTELAQRLLAVPDTISLQPEDTVARDMLETAQIIAGLDLVVTIDTSVAHLTGALGKRGIVLLQHNSVDWRWRESTPGVSYWYPSLRLLRQPKPGDWGSLIEGLRTELRS